MGMCVVVLPRMSGKCFPGGEGSMIEVIVSRRAHYILETSRNFGFLEHKFEDDKKYVLRDVLSSNIDL